MDYEKNKTSYQDEEWFEREQRNVLDVRNWNRDLMGQTFDYELKDITKLDDFNQIVDWKNSSFIKQPINHPALLSKYQ